MKLKAVNKNLFFAGLVLLIGYSNKIAAQKIQYSRGNVFINNPGYLQLVANIGGNHHLVSIVENENPVLFIFNRELALEAKMRAPFRFPERGEMRIIRFDNFYYLYLHPRLSQDYFLWKVDANGSFTDFTPAFQKLLRSQSQNIKLGFELIANQNELCMVYHTALTDVKKSTVIVVQTDSLLNSVFTHKVVYDFKGDEEKLVQEVLLSGKYLLVLKTGESGTSLELMKVNLATGYSITNTFRSSGYFYSESSFNYNMVDSTVTVSAMLTEPRAAGRQKRFVFISRLNNILVEQVPFAILKSQFLKNTGANFLLVDGLSKWIRLRTFPEQGIRFSLLDKNFTVIGDSLIANTKDSYTIRADQFARFNVNNKEYMLVGQRFSKNNRGVLMLNANDAHKLVFTDVRVNNRNDYLLSKAQLIPEKSIIVPYINKREAGLIKITIE